MQPQILSLSHPHAAWLLRFLLKQYWLSVGREVSEAPGGQGVTGILHTHVTHSTAQTEPRFLIYRKLNPHCNDSFSCLLLNSENPGHNGHSKAPGSLRCPVGGCRPHSWNGRRKEPANPPEASGITVREAAPPSLS